MIVTTIPQNILTCQRRVKALPTLYETFNDLVNRITIQGIVITILHFYYYSYFFCSVLNLIHRKLFTKMLKDDLTFIISLFDFLGFL
jgi:hypothetical protein